MKNIFKTFAAMLCILSVTFAFTACEGNNADNGNGVELFSFGPCPVLRGDTIKFLGSNLNRVTEVTIPSGISITDIIRVSDTEIAVEVPQEAESGYVTLIYPGGEIVTSTLLSFVEPYTITSISPVGTEVRAGDEITITGDYLNNIAKVVFGGEAAVEMADFTAQSRTEIKLNLPAEAISGKLYVVDGNGNQLYSDEELTVLQPEIVSIAPLTIKPGENLTIEGTNLDLVASVEFAGGDVVEEFVSQSESEIVVASPLTMLDGAVTITSKAAQKVVSADELVCVAPENVAVAAESVYKAGLNVVITGDDIDLVTAVQFAGTAAASEFTFADDKITAAIPAEAVDGIITLTTAAGKTVETSAITLVKPVIVSYESIDIMSGEDIIAHGNDLDLVTKITLAGEEMTFTYDATSGDIVVNTLLTSKTGVLTIFSANGVSENVGTITLTLDAIVKVDVLPESASCGDKITIEGSNFNKIETIKIGEAKVTEYISRSDTAIEFVVPEVEAGTYPLTFLLTTGEVENSVPTITVGVVLTRVDLISAPMSIEGWGNIESLAWGGKGVFADMPYGATLVFEFTRIESAEDTQLKLCDPSDWSVLPGPTVNEWGVITDITNTSTSYSYAFDDSVIDVFRARGIIISGKFINITALYYTY